MALPPRLYQFLVAAFASLGSALFGYDLGVIAGVIGSPSFISEFHPTTNEIGAVVSVFTGGCFFGAALAGWLSDRFGRKWTIFVGSLIFLLGGGLQTGAQNLSYLYAGRAIAGLGVGDLVMIIPLYQAELCHPDIRGRVTSLQQFMLGVGVILASWTTYGTFELPNDDSKQWRVPLGIQLVPAGILLLLIMLFPESPRWLMAHGQQEKSLTTLASLHANGDTNDAFVRAEYEAIRDDLREEKDKSASIFELIKDKSCFRRLVLAMAIQASIQMTGVAAIQYYSITFFKQIGIDGTNALKYQAIGSVIALLGEVSCMTFIDRLGRRWVLIGCNIGSGFCFLVATIVTALFPPGSTNNKSAGWTFIAMTWIFQYTFSFGCGPLSWIIPAEIFDTRTRSKGVAIATMTSFAFNTLIGQVSSIALANVGWRYYIVFIVTCTTNALFFWAFLPETKKIPLEEMQYLFKHAPLFIPTADMKQHRQHDLRVRVEQMEAKRDVIEVEIVETIGAPAGSEMRV